MTATTLPTGEASPTAPARRPRGIRPARPRRDRVSLLAAPALAWYLLFMLGPLLAMFVIAALHWPGMLEPRSWAGLANMRTVLTDAVFWTAVQNTAVQLVGTLPLMIACAFMLAYYVTQRPRGHRVLRFLLFVPGLISHPAKAMVFYAILAPDGLANGMLDSFGLGGLSNAWLADSSTALGSLMLIDLWGGIGFTAVLFAARMGSVPEDVTEAAALDGAGHWRRMWGVVFPIVRDYVGVATMLQFLWTLFGSAQNVLLLTQGGPGNSSTTLSFLVYQKAFQQSDLGYSQAAGVVLFVVGLCGMVLIRRVLRSTH